MRAVSSAMISVRVQANAHRDELVEVREGVLLVRVAAPAVGRPGEPSPLPTVGQEGGRAPLAGDDRARPAVARQTDPGRRSRSGSA
jgi:hypothetical protein